MVWAAVWLAVLAVVAETAMGGTVTAEQPFNVKPNGRLEFVAVEVGGGTGLACVFEYAAVGGTNEDWLAVAEVGEPGSDGQPSVTCTFARPDTASYLFFNSFAARMVDDDGNVVAASHAELWDNSGMLLEGEAYVLDAAGALEKGPAFDGLVTRVALSRLE
ncbi:UPF0556 protein [Thecamonas trahens ATCC 50062]|uniref:UPF0556 protein n=1 Tax=Thecamonas trahens ATCC 50062 TaxID=461836 RepID=A0A0L0D7B5_THETB|nr:UPF0556 protein [Thecamonas trahens ATCC 50062]KNC48277.1 UPF0556 protein [Thecamonas trahens ATCC 50062]|eukprot:XP_013758844.1 UPF0556 protein [Thecamonas trahens ATCC 50062]